RRVRQIIRDGIRDLENGSEEDPITQDLEEVIQNAQAFSESGDDNSAIVMLEAITQACAEDWSDLEDYGADSDATVAALNEAWTEAILSAELTPEQVIDLQVELESWQDQLGSFEMSLEALRQGWTDPPLLRVLGGEISELGSWEGDAPDYSDDLALIRLRILDRQARHDEYLYLAEAEGQTQCYLTMLAQLGRIAEAVSAAQTNMSVMEEAFALAKTLRDQNAVPEALEIAQAGLSLPGHCGYDFATWTSDLAQGLGQPDLALRASTIAFKTRPNFTDYRRVERLAGSDWTTHKIELLAPLRSSQGWESTQAKVDIFLHEGLIEDAISVVSDQSSYQSVLIQRVMDAAMPSHSSWVIENARRRAESIMDAKKAEQYGHAIEWLKKARAAYLHLEQRAEWITYRTQLMQTHARKHKLMGLLKHRDLD
ncbi:MAG: SWIM zinc finger domain-containing protein, partial [Phormidesmis sp. CAN_BIN44]|nr:SWIM zinc finger domain-containing protein [Phormidesmis sp. CAN_BIN44]